MLTSKSQNRFRKPERFRTERGMCSIISQWSTGHLQNAQWLGRGGAAMETRKGDLRLRPQRASRLTKDIDQELVIIYNSKCLGGKGGAQTTDTCPDGDGGPAARSACPTPASHHHVTSSSKRPHPVPKVQFLISDFILCFPILGSAPWPRQLGCKMCRETGNPFLHSALWSIFYFIWKKKTYKTPL